MSVDVHNATESDRAAALPRIIEQEPLVVLLQCLRAAEVVRRECIPVVVAGALCDHAASVLVLESRGELPDVPKQI